MRIWSKLAILSAIFATCLPARGEILIYQMSMSFFSTLGDEEPWTSVSQEKVTSYLILDVEYASDGTIESVNNAVRYELERYGIYKWYVTETHYFDVANVEVRGRMTLALVEKEYLAGAEIFVLTGQTRNTGIGLSGGEQRSVAKRLTGNIMVVITGEEGGYQICDVSMRLNSRWTKSANNEYEGNQDFDYAAESIVEPYLEGRGYKKG